MAVEPPVRRIWQNLQDAVSLVVPSRIAFGAIGRYGAAAHALAAGGKRIEFVISK